MKPRKQFYPKEVLPCCEECQPTIEGCHSSVGIILLRGTWALHHISSSWLWIRTSRFILFLPPVFLSKQKTIKIFFFKNLKGKYIITLLKNIYTHVKKMNALCHPCHVKAQGLKFFRFKDEWTGLSSSGISPPVLKGLSRQLNCLYFKWKHYK